MRKQFYLALLLLLLGFKASASHAASAEIRYEYTGVGNVYRVYYSFYYQCSPGYPTLFGNMSIQFVSTNSSNFMRSIHKVDSIYYTNSCYYNGLSNTTCDSITSTSGYPGYYYSVYSDTVTLSPSQWKISCSVGARNQSISNLTNPGASFLYVEAYLNNATQINSSAKIFGPAAVIMGDTNNSVSTIPIQSSDLENDSLVYEWYQPQDWQSTGVPNPTPIPYNTGYSFAQPLGPNGYVGFNPSNQTMQLISPTLGYKQLAFRVKDYRNGVLMGYTSRDFQVIRINIPHVSNPLVAPNSVLNYTTCPGNTNNISLSFVDSIATDSVYLTVTPPSIPGFTFNVTNNNGIGTASTNISWTTPANFNPATLPNFYIGIKARNNQCPTQGISFYAIKVNTTQCVADSVWAGDANGDWTVNNYDPLAIGVAYGHTGWLRPGATTNWQAEFCNNWVDTFANGINMKHADCNGDGVVDTLDIAPIYTNFGNWHLKPSPAAKTTNVPNLYFDISGIPFIAGTTVNIPVKLGDATNPMSNIYGIAGGIQLSGITLATAPQISYTGSWLGNVTNTLHFNKSAVSGTIDWALSRIDHQNTSGQGTIAWVSFHIPADANGQTLALSFSNIKLVDKALGNITSFNALDTSVLIHTMGINDFNATIQNAAIVPNPSHNEAALSFSSIKAFEMKIEAFDVSGKMVFNQTTFATKGINEIKLPTQSLSQGVYIVKLSGNDFLETMKWVKE